MTFMPKFSSEVMQESLVSKYKQEIAQLEQENEALSDAVIQLHMKTVYMTCLIEDMKRKGYDINSFVLTKEDISLELTKAGVNPEEVINLSNLMYEAASEFLEE